MFKFAQRLAEIWTLSSLNEGSQSRLQRKLHGIERKALCSVCKNLSFENSMAGGRTSVKRLTIAAFLAVCAFVPQASAQKNELSGLVGRTFISSEAITGSTGFDNRLRFGKGLTAEVNYARHVMSLEILSLSLEVPFLLNPDVDLHAAPPNRVPEHYSSYIVTPAARVNFFQQTGVSPWVSFGGGFAHYSADSTLLFGGTNPSKGGTTNGVLQFGAGLDVKLIKSFALRGEVRDFWSGVPPVNVNTGNSRQHNIFVGGGIVWHF
jgi:hypothetical protein